MSGLLLIAAGSISVLVSKGLWEFVKLFNPFNIVNFLTMVAVLAPGMSLRAWADHIDRKADK